MASDEELLLNSLKELREADLKEFQWHLKKDHKCITESEMENADRLKTVSKMVACFGPEEAVKTTVKILRKMNQNHLAEQLEKKHKPARVQERSSAQLGASVVHVNDEGGASVVHIKAEGGASLNAPVMIGNNFSGPVHFNK